MSQASINWEDVRQRLRRSEEALNDALSDNPERMQAVFRQRAAKLAGLPAEAPGTEDKPASKRIPALVFRLATERYAIALAELAEVTAFNGCTQVPGSSPRIMGVINLRGELRPVINLAHVLAGGVPSAGGSLLILRRQIALKVDSVEHLREIRSDELTPRASGRFVQGMLSGTLSLLSGEAMLAALFSASDSQSV